MSEDLEQLWGKLSLTKEEQIDVILDKDWCEEVNEVGKYCIIGKMVLNRRVNMEAMKNVLCNVWKSFFGMSIKEVRDRLYIFKFENQMEKEKVLMKQPWTFNKSLLVL